MIFCIDLDGTLIDSTERHYILFKKIMSNYQLNDERIRKLDFLEYKRDGYSTKSFCKKVLNLSDKIAEEISKEWILHIEDKEYIDLDKLYPDAIPFLKELSESINTITYLSARSNRDLAFNELKELDLLLYASEVYIVSPNNSIREKREVVKSLMQSDSVCMLGDTEVENSIAEEFGLISFILNRGFRSKKFWDQKNINSLSSLTEIRIESGNSWGL